MHRLTLTLLFTSSLICCSAPSKPAPRAATAPVTPDPAEILVDFEKPDTFARWEPFIEPTAPATEPAETQPAVPNPLMRSSLRPQSGLWSAKVSLREQLSPKSGGTLWYRATTPLDLAKFNILEAGALHLAIPASNGQWTAALILEDGTGKRLEGDSFPINSRWEQVHLDLRWAYDQGLEISNISQIGLVLRPIGTPAAQIAATEPDSEPAPPFEIQTDAWKALTRGKSYIGNRAAVGGATAGRGFFVESQATRLRIGNTGAVPWEISFWGRGTTPDPRIQRPWMEVWSPGIGGAQQRVIGNPGTGLMLLSPDSAAQLAPALQRGPDDISNAPVAALPALGWPLVAQTKSGTNDLELTTSCRWHWEVVWTSPVGAIVEVKQEAGPYDRLGEPAAMVTWRFMIYQWGQVFARAEWTRGESPVPAPVSWALVLPQDVAQRGAALGLGLPAGDDAQTAAANAERLLSEVYPVSVREALQTALPHRMQTGNPVIMLGKPPAAPALARNAWWWAKGTAPGDDHAKKIAGTAIAPQPLQPSVRGSADCMLLVNAPNALMKAAAFGQYLVPPKILFRQGELDRNFPGDSDNDGFVEAYGFQSIRLANGRATFTIYPQQRPIFYPAYLFTVPAVEKEALDLAHSRILINIDGKQFADPPQFPDGSFLLQLPFTLDRPVTVEALLIKK